MASLIHLCGHPVHISLNEILDVFLLRGSAPLLSFTPSGLAYLGSWDCHRPRAVHEIDIVFCRQPMSNVGRHVDRLPVSSGQERHHGDHFCRHGPHGTSLPELLAAQRLYRRGCSGRWMLFLLLHLVLRLWQRWQSLIHSRPVSINTIMSCALFMQRRTGEVCMSCAGDPLVSVVVCVGLGVRLAMATVWAARGV